MYKSLILHISLRGEITMINYFEWRISAGGQTEIREYPQNYTYDDVYDDLVNECGFPEDVQIKRVKS
jgi:hypothetical protein